jgi:cytochrome P450
MFSNNDPLHGRIRRLVSPAFTPRRMEQERIRVRALAGELIDEALAEGQVDVMATIAHNLPSRVMSELFQIPESDREMFSDWTTDIGLAFGAAGDPEIRSRVENALSELDRYTGELIEERRRNMGDDLLSSLIAVEEQGDRLSPRELSDLIENLLFAGHDTTRGAIGVVFWVLNEHPDAQRELRADSSLVANAVDEMLRYEAITFSTARTATEDVTIDGVLIEQGSPLGVCLPSASRDPRAYDNPDSFDIRRPDPRPPTFGAGAHYCLGAALARMELQELTSELLGRTTSFAVLDAPRWVPFAHIRRYERLDVELTAA